MNTILEAKGLYKKFEDAEVLKGIDMIIEEGEFVAVMGQSGSGKSTLLYNISGMDRATAGEIRFEGDEISHLEDEKISYLRLERMGFIFQQSYLLRTLSIRDNIVLPGYKAGKVSREQVNAYAEELMERTGIDHIGDHDIKKVSGGQLQRGAICRALINRPDILFADEPTGALNTAATGEIMDILNEVNREGKQSMKENHFMEGNHTVEENHSREGNHSARGCAIMLVTHDAKVAARADRVIFLADGKVTDEIKLGKYKKQDKAEREYKMAKWLEQQGF